MQSRLLDLLACPVDNEELSFNGVFFTCMKCFRVFPIQSNIPQLIVDEELEMYERYWENDPTVDVSFMRGGIPANVSNVRCKVRDEAFESGDSVLDVGCGSCIDYPLYRANEMFYVGIDVTQKLLLAAENFASNILRVRGNALRLPFKDRSFDSVYCKDLLLHLGPEAYKTVLSEMWRITKKKLMVVGVGNENVKDVVHNLNLQNKLCSIRVYGTSYPKAEIKKTLSRLKGIDHLTFEKISLGINHPCVKSFFIAHK